MVFVSRIMNHSALYINVILPNHTKTSYPVWNYIEKLRLEQPVYWPVYKRNSVYIMFSECMVAFQGEFCAMSKYLAIAIRAKPNDCMVYIEVAVLQRVHCNSESQLYLQM